MISSELCFDSLREFTAMSLVGAAKRAKQLPGPGLGWLKMWGVWGAVRGSGGLCGVVRSLWGCEGLYGVVWGCVGL